ncbi:MAG: GIY-YIG nuclease family protein [Chloroflexi bacterium]|nr:GIY-YIG nuclease family protein [Chloroflexota bacterium]
MSSHTRVLYIGITNDLERRVHEHRTGSVPGFSSKYRTRALVYFEETGDVREALQRERSMKGWSRARKVHLIESTNPEWCDLSEAWRDGSADSG